MAKKKAQEAPMADDEQATNTSEPSVEASAASTESDAVTAAQPIIGRSQHVLEEERHPMVAAGDPHGAQACVAKDGPGPRSYYLIVDGVRHVHVGDTADGRWIYRPDY